MIHRTGNCGTCTPRQVAKLRGPAKNTCPLQRPFFKPKLFHQHQHFHYFSRQIHDMSIQSSETYCDLLPQAKRNLSRHQFMHLSALSPLDGTSCLPSKVTNDPNKSSHARGEQRFVGRMKKSKIPIQKNERSEERNDTPSSDDLSSVATRSSKTVTEQVNIVE
ncbi:unnamed protein product [Protopolystoma xenopodis]|uniref:Uncharacterized protein n=1 Tax=Protopolystoma xenopodis TaxID=117903 RepID=A0A448XHI6_9PLAT|nr:unnamed protein product [Protopolystoma xenopodis]